MKHFASQMRSPLVHLRWFPLAALGLGCGSQASTEYLGESLISVSGSVVIDNADAPAELVPVLVFETQRIGEPSNVLRIVDVVHRGEFPSRFQLSVFDAPPDAAVAERVTKSGRRARCARSTSRG